MAVVVEQRDAGVEAAVAPGPGTRAGGPGAPRAVPTASASTVAVVVVGLALLAAFVAHLARFGAWVVDDAGISMAYAINLARGHGLVAQPGAAQVEAFSDPLWVGLLALTSRAGLLGSTDVLGMPGYVLVVKGFAVVFQAVVLGGSWVLIRRILTVVGHGPPAPVLAHGCWAAVGLLLAANPSYVIWMGSGLENPLFAAEVVGLAALAAVALPTPGRRAMVGLGLLAAAAALTRPDGAVYAGVVLLVALLAAAPSARARLTMGAWGMGTFAVVFGAYLAFRRASFHAWVPNTAVAKGQQLPGLSDLERLDPLARAFGLPLMIVAGVGVVVCGVRLVRARDANALRVVTAVLGVCGAGILAYVVLPADWMAELRFLTPVWPLLSVAAVLGVVQLAALASTPALRAAVAVALVFFAVSAVSGWRTRSDGFRAGPTLPLCDVAVRYGTTTDAVARALGRDPAATRVVLPDIGGVLLGARVEVVDLAGLADPTIARLIADDRAGAIADHILTAARPVVVHVHGDWVARSGLTDDPRFAERYVDVRSGEDWVARAAIDATPDPAATLAQLRRLVASAAPPGPRAACGEVLFG